MKNTEKIKNMNRKIYLGVVVIAVIFLMSGSVSATTIEVTNEVTGTDISTGQATYKVNVYDSNDNKIGTYDVTRDAFGPGSVPGDPCNPLPELDRYGTNHECPPSTLAQGGRFYGSHNKEGHDIDKDGILDTPWIQIGSTEGSSTIKKDDNPSNVERTVINFHPNWGGASWGCMGIHPKEKYDDFRNKVNNNGDLDNGKVRVKSEDRYTQTGDGIKRCCTTSDGKSGIQTCSGGSWGTCGACLDDQWCEEGECVPEASTLVLFAVGLLSLVGYLGFRRKED